MKINKILTHSFKSIQKEPIGIKNYMNAIKTNDKAALNTPFEQSSNIASDTQKIAEKINKKAIIGGIVAFTAISGAAIYILKGKGNKVKNIATEAGKEIIDNLKTTDVAKTETIKEFAKKSNMLDFEYKTQFTQGLKEVFGIEKNVEDVKSIMGPKEFEKLLKKLDGKDLVVHEDAVSFMERMLKMPCNEKWEEFIPRSGSQYCDFLNKQMPKEELENYYRPLINGTCRLFLTSEIDAVDSDSQKVAKNFLDRAVEYANKVARNIQDDKPPFTVGVINSRAADPKILQEITKELAQDPEKYKNLKVIYGTNFPKIRPGKIYNAKYFINPFDNEFVDNFNKANEIRISDIKHMFKNIFIPPENAIGKEISPYALLNQPTWIKLKHPNGIPKDWKLLTDDEIEEFFKDPKLKRSSNTKTDSYELFKAFYEKYLKKQVALEPDLPFNESDKYNIEEIFSELIEDVTDVDIYSPSTFKARCEMKFTPESSKFIHEFHPDEGCKLLKSSMFDQLSLRSFIKRHNNNAYGLPGPSRGAIESFGKALFQDECAGYDPHALMSKKEIVKMLDKKKKEICLPYLDYKPSKYIFGDRVKITEELWQKIIQ